MRLLLLALLCGVFLGTEVHAQAFQSTVKSNPETQNPQTQPTQTLGASTAVLQGGTESQTLGASINQLAFAGEPSKLAVETTTETNTNDKQPSILDDPRQLENSRPRVSRKVIVATGVITLLAAFWVVYQAITRSMR